MLLEKTVEPDVDAFCNNLLRKGTPRRVHYAELFQDAEIRTAIAARYGIGATLDKKDPFYALRFDVELQRFLGYDMVRGYLTLKGGAALFPRPTHAAADTTDLAGQRRAQRNWTDEHSGPVTSWEQFEKYPWPDPKNLDLRHLEWFEKNLDPRMGVYVGCHQIFEQVTWLMGYETLCLKLYDDPALVDAMFERVGRFFVPVAEVACDFACVKALFGGDDMGYKTATMVPPDVLIKKSFPWHRKISQVAHKHGKLNILHSCGNLETVMEQIIDYCQYDAKHSFEDVIEPIAVAKKRWGKRIALLGGIDVDFLARASEPEIRRRVRETLDICMTGGGYCLGSGNSVTNYIPVENYLVMLDEGRRYAA
jgi:uroporphyrinogen decarboxylase